MESMELRKDFYWTGITDEKLRVFDIIMYTEFGTTYNSYVLKTGGKTILFETAKELFFEEYLEKLREITDISSIDYVVVDHTEPDHAGSIVRLLEINPGLKILGTGCALGFLKEIVNRDFVGIVVKDGERMKIGEMTLRFLSVPNLHWPDTMYTYIEEEQILVSCDSFGAHYAFSEVLVSKVTNREDYIQAAKYYFDNIIGPFKSYMRTALERVRELDITMICTGHGPVLDSRIPQMLDTYEEWCREEEKGQDKSVVIPYVSAYGYTKELAGQIEKGIKSSGNIRVRSYDLVEADKEEVIKELALADGILIGTPTILGEALAPIWEIVNSMYPVTHGGKLAGAFGSYGWSGEGVLHVTERLKQLRMRTVEGFRVRFRPDAGQMLDAYEFGYQFGCTLLKKENTRKAGRNQLVKCLVCGEIFDSSLEICPVCGVGKENFVSVEDTAGDFQRNSENVYLILGNGAAGVNAAQAIRERDKTGSITMISEEPYSTYNRPMLTKSVISGLDAKQIAVHEERWYEENDIYQMLGKKVEKIDVEKKEVLLDDGTKLNYTKLIYALGAECFIPPIKGVDKPQAIAIRRLADVKAAAALLPAVRQAVVIGGGVLGLEAAWELHKYGCKVTVLELAPVIMGRQLDNSAALLLEKIAEDQDIQIRTGVKIAEITGESSVTGVRLEEGEILDAQLVILSCGIKPNTQLASLSGMQAERFVFVNERMETSVEDVYACGDCAQFEGESYGLWSQAVEQGKTAGANAAGDMSEYKNIFPALHFHGMGTSLFAAGDNGKNKDLLYKTVELKDIGKLQYQKLYFLNNRLCGVILIGDVSRMAELTAALEQQAVFSEVVK